MSHWEARAANRLLLYAMLLAASYTMMRAVGDSLFLSRIGNQSLAVVFVISGIATTVFASLWYMLTRRLDLSKLVKVSGISSAFITLVFWAALPYFHHSWWLLAAIYLLTEIKGCTNSINVVLSMNEILGGHSSRQAWARIGLGAPFAGLVIGLLIGLEASQIDLRSWLLFSACLDLLAIVPLVNTSRLVVHKSQATPAATGSMISSWDSVIDKAKPYVNSRHFRFWFSLFVGAKIVVLTMITFFWKFSANEYFSWNEQLLAQYFGVFYACTGIVTLLLQLFVTRHFLERRGLHVPILAMPVVLTILWAIVMISASVWLVFVAITLAKAAEVWRRSVQDTTLNILYTSIERKRRRSMISITTGIVKPLAEVGASLVLLVGSIAWHKSIVLLAVTIWIIAAFALLRLFSQAPSKLSPKAPLFRRARNQTAYSDTV